MELSVIETDQEGADLIELTPEDEFVQGTRVIALGNQCGLLELIGKFVSVKPDLVTERRGIQLFGR
ncbi:hypothetical protein D9M70_476740 [compost metagenome]